VGEWQRIVFPFSVLLESAPSPLLGRPIRGVPPSERGGAPLPMEGDAANSNRPSHFVSWHINTPSNEQHQ
jgi:hypothetical protein